MSKFISIILVSIVLLSFNSFASLIGDEVFLTCMQSSGSDHELCEGNSDLSSIVIADVEYPDYFNFENSLSIDINANSIWVTFDNGPYCGWFTCDGQGFLEFSLTDLDWVGMPSSFITGINVDTNMTGIQTGFDGNSVNFALPETSVNSDMFVYIDILTDHSEVSEPSIIAIFALALIGLTSRRLVKTRH